MNLREYIAGEVTAALTDRDTVVISKGSTSIEMPFAVANEIGLIIDGWRRVVTVIEMPKQR